MHLKPQDVVILIKLCLDAGQAWSYNQLAYELRMSPSEVHKGLKRADHARLYHAEARAPRRAALGEFLIHGVKYAYAPEIGPTTRGVPTAEATPGLRQHFTPGGEIHVWPHPQGEARGLGVSPLFKNVPDVALADDRFHRALGALDAIRMGRIRERRMAEGILLQLLEKHA